MNENHESELQGVYASSVLDFVRAANSYCEFIETAGEKTGIEFIEEAVQYLAQLYLAAVKLERTEPVLESANEKLVSEQDWSRVYQTVLRLLGSHNAYLRIADDEEFDRSDLVSHPVSEDMADVYQDVKDFTFQYRQGVEEIMNDALYEVTDSFDQYWSEKLLNALSALNKLFVNKVDPGAGEDEPESGSNPAYNNSLFTRLQDRNNNDDDDV